MRICLDIDGVLLPDVKGEGGPDAYYNRRPFEEAIFHIQRLKKEGHYLILYTSRGMKTCKDDGQSADTLHRARLEEWLELWEIPYDQLICGKPRADIYVDDKAFRLHGGSSYQWENLKLLLDHEGSPWNP